MGSKVPTGIFKTVKNLIQKYKGDRELQPVKNGVYAVGTGTYVGELFVFVKKQGDNYCFLSVPKNRNREVPVDKFEFALKHKIIEFVELLPKPIHKLCIAQHQYNEKHTNSRNSIEVKTK